MSDQVNISAAPAQESPTACARPLVSILIPSYNAEKWLAQCLDSALGQTYPSIEVVVVDDGSKDGSVEILKQYAGKIRFYTGPNHGANAARNRLMSLSSGQWLQFLDADDYLLPDKIERQIEFIGKHPELDVVYAPSMIRVEPSGHEYLNPVEDKDDAILTFIRWQFTTHAPLFRRAAVLAAGGWKESQPCCQENEVLLRLIRRGAEFGLCDVPSAVYRFHGTSSISKKDPQRVIRQRMKLTDEMEAYLIQSDRMTAAHRLAIARSRFESARSIFPMDRNYAKKLADRARSQGPVPATRALPWTYRLVLGSLGFEWAELFAASRRNFFARFSLSGQLQ